MFEDKINFLKNVVWETLRPVLKGPCVRKLFTGLIMYLPSQNKEHCIVLYCIVMQLFKLREKVSSLEISSHTAILLTKVIAITSLLLFYH